MCSSRDPATRGSGKALCRKCSANDVTHDLDAKEVAAHGRVRELIQMLEKQASDPAACTMSTHGAWYSGYNPSTSVEELPTHWHPLLIPGELQRLNSTSSDCSCSCEDTSVLESSAACSEAPDGPLSPAAQSRGSLQQCIVSCSAAAFQGNAGTIPDDAREWYQGSGPPIAVYDDQCRLCSSQEVVAEDSCAPSPSNVSSKLKEGDNVHQQTWTAVDALSHWESITARSGSLVQTALHGNVRGRRSYAYLARQRSQEAAPAGIADHAQPQNSNQSGQHADEGVGKSAFARFSAAAWGSQERLADADVVTRGLVEGAESTCASARLVEVSGTAAASTAVDGIAAQLLAIAARAAQASEAAVARVRAAEAGTLGPRNPTNVEPCTIGGGQFDQPATPDLQGERHPASPLSDAVSKEQQGRPAEWVDDVSELSKQHAAEVEQGGQTGGQMHYPGNASAASVRNRASGLQQAGKWLAAWWGGVAAADVQDSAERLQPDVPVSDTQGPLQWMAAWRRAVGEGEGGEQQNSVAASAVVPEGPVAQELRRLALQHASPATTSHFALTAAAAQGMHLDHLVADGNAVTVADTAAVIPARAAASVNMLPFTVQPVPGLAGMRVATTYAALAEARRQLGLGLQA